MNPVEFRPKAEEIPGQKQPYPARQSAMNPVPDSDLSNYKPAGKLIGKVAIITGADSGIGRAVAIAFAMEGADVAVVYNENTDDAKYTQRTVESKGRSCLLLKADVRQKSQCEEVVRQTVERFGKLNILVNNAAFQMAQENIEDITEEQLRRSFDTNIIAYFFMVQAALPHLTDGDAIVNTGSIVGIVGNPILVDYTATKGAIHAFTKSLAIQLGKRNIRVNCVAPGPVWTPNIPGTMPESEVQNFGHEVALARPGQPEELTPAYVLLASGEGSFMTGSIVEVTGGKLG
ncbi:SDR family oxidoreductase [Spirosoma sp. KNUC1025]|uniref:SDR family oxidoreductase n=1 Tax=Spirosoma sp. KNUC1025 TaxID=2894082 RepID=UPI003867CD32|nr:SDR family oxidoreductase [Spirosoma sp. KNUC1025]